MLEYITKPCETCGGVGHITTSVEVDDPGVRWRNVHQCSDTETAYAWGACGSTVECPECGGELVIVAEDQTK